MRVKLGDVCSSIYDGDHNAPPKSESGVPFITISNIDANDGAIDFSNTAFVPEEYYESLKVERRPKCNDVLYSVVGSFGIPSLVRNDSKFVFQRHVAILRPSKAIDPAYLYYVLKDPSFFHWADAVAIGAAQRTVTLGQLRAKEIELPDMETQRHVADVLSAYDELIENNRRQIKLLEEAAQCLYKEWFIDLKFPGHETTPIVDGLPEGWKYGTLGDLLDECGARIGAHEREKFEHYLPIDSLPSKSFTCWDSRPICEAESSLVAFKENDFIFGAMRPYFHKVVVAPYAGITRSTCFVLGARDAMAGYFAYISLFREQTIRYATSISVGTTMPYVRWSDLKRMRIVIPWQSVQRSYSSMVTSIFNEISVLEKSIAITREARDRLLPKLMSGEIEV